MATVKQSMNLIKLVETFGSDDRCREYLEALRWPKGPVCPRCASVSTSRISTRNQLDCNYCRFRFSVTSGTIFHDSHLSLWKWFATTYLMIESKKGVSANQIKRTIGSSYKTAWYLCHRIRAAMYEVAARPLQGTVEADETYVGGRRRRVGRGYKDNKTMVLGVVERGGEVRLRVARPSGPLDPNMRRVFLKATVSPWAKRIMTDEHSGYQGIGDHDTTHHTVRHADKEYVRGDVHTNTVDNVWSLLNRSIMGAYHKISTKHLDAYLDELEWRFNNRKNPYLFRETLKRLLDSKSVPYKDLVRAG